MIKLSESKWNVDVVKGQPFQYFKENIELLIAVGNIEKCSDSEIRRVFEKLTGSKVEQNKNNKK